MKVDSLFTDYSVNNQTNGSQNPWQTNSKTGFAASLQSAMVGLAQTGASDKQYTTSPQSFSYAIPVMASSEGNSGDFNFNEYGLDDYGDAAAPEWAFTDSYNSAASAYMNNSKYSDILNGAINAYNGFGGLGGLGGLEAAVPAPTPYPTVDLSPSAQAMARRNRAIMDSFDVENNRKYMPNRDGKGETYCNIYVADVSKELGAPVPRRIYLETGAPVTDDGQNGTVSYLNANRMNDWLNGSGRNHGWSEVDAPMAQYYANQGQVVVATWKAKDNSSGHIQMVSPSKDNAYNEKLGVTVAQAGSVVKNYCYIEDIYKTSTLKEVQYFVSSGAQAV